MPIYGTTVTLTAVVAYPTAPQVSCDFEPDEWAFRNKCVDRDMYVSFDGIHDDLEMTPNEPDEAKTVRSKARKVWFRCSAVGGTAPVTMRVEISTDC